MKVSQGILSTIVCFIYFDRSRLIENEFILSSQRNANIVIAMHTVLVVTVFADMDLSEMAWTAGVWNI